MDGAVGLRCQSVVPGRDFLLRGITDREIRVLLRTRYLGLHHAASTCWLLGHLEKVVACGDI